MPTATSITYDAMEWLSRQTHSPHESNSMGPIGWNERPFCQIKAAKGTIPCFATSSNSVDSNRICSDTVSPVKREKDAVALM